MLPLLKLLWSLISTNQLTPQWVNMSLWLDLVFMQRVGNGLVWQTMPSRLRLVRMRDKTLASVLVWGSSLAMRLNLVGLGLKSGLMVLAWFLGFLGLWYLGCLDFIFGIQMGVGSESRI